MLHDRKRFFYEVRPFIFIALALGTIFKGDGSGLMSASAALLLLASIYIVYMRAQYRWQNRIR